MSTGKRCLGFLATAVLPASLLAFSCDTGEGTSGEKPSQKVGTLHLDGLFELGPGDSSDEGGLTNILGNLVDNGPDWDDIFQGNPDGTVTVKNAFGGVVAFVKDDVSAGGAVDSTVYAGSSSDKNGDTVGSWDWGSNSVPPKDDITNAYVYSKLVNGQMMLYVGVEREDPSGASHVDIEFFQKSVSLDKAPPCGSDGAPAGDGSPCEFTGQNTNNDVLVTLDYKQGGAFSALEVRKRHEGVNGNYDFVTSLGQQGCGVANPDAGVDHTVCAFTNGGPIDGGSWRNFDNHGAEITNLPTNSFAEFAINVTALLGTTPCFSTVQVKTRSSPSFTAELKDFALAPFAQCNATASTQIHSGDSVGATHSATDIQNTTISMPAKVHDKAIVTGTPGFATPTGTVTFKRYTTSDCSGTSTDETVALTQVTAPTATTAGVAAAESATFSPSAGPMSYKAVYDGDANYPTAAIAACEPLTVSKVNSAVNTDIRKDNVNGISVMNKAVDTSTIVVDVATITGSAGVDPTGDVLIKRYATGNCSGTYSSQTLTLSADADSTDGIATAVSNAFTLDSAAGSLLSYVVEYKGDGNYNSSVSSKCEPVCQFTFTGSQP